jgi:hypothetical protein
MSRLWSRRGRVLAVLLWGLALLLTQAARGPLGTHLGSVPLPGHVRLHGTRSRGASGSVSQTEADPESAVLGHARTSEFVPATNLQGRSGGAAWLFLLPSLELGLVLCVGSPSAAGLRTLAEMADEVVVCGSRCERWHVRRSCARLGLTGIEALAPKALPTRRADLMVVSGDNPLASDPRLAAALRRARAAFFDHAGVEPAPGAYELQLAPAAGEPRVAAADADGATLAYLRRSNAAGDGAGGSRRAVLAAHGVSTGRLRPPAYIQELAARFGVDLDAYRVGLAAPTGYASRKTVMFLFRGDEREPELVIKLARDPRQNRRLANEWRALGWLRDAYVPGDFPRPVFFGHHAGLALLGETAVAGSPFRSRTSGRYDCPLAHGALEWLGQLAVATAHPAADKAEVGVALGELSSRFAGLYRMTRAQRTALLRHVDALGSADCSLPLVLQHGDPGTWNLFVGAGGTPAFLDWEAAERHGMPLWDVFYFARSFAVTVARAKGRTSRLGAVRRELLAGGPVNQLLASAVERHCLDIGLERKLVEPLFVTCWMHRALKEATRLSPARLDTGHYVNLLRLCLDRSDAPGLRRLYRLS